MNLIAKLTLLLIAISFLNCSSKKEKLLQINGTVVGTNSKSIILMKHNQDMRFDSLIEIPVKNKKFHFVSKLDHPEAVMLMLGEAKESSGGQFMQLFLENEKIELTIYPDDFHKNSIKGGKLNKQYQTFKIQEDSIFKEKPFEERLKWEQNFIYENPSLVSYSLFIDQLIYFKEIIDKKLIKRNYNKLKKANPNHPYNNLALKLINAIENIQIGKKYIDFLAPDLNGSNIKLSEKINGQIALLDLWATWCGPCIRKSREMLPIYNEFKDKGFTIIGVAGEFKNTDRLVKFLEKEKWPWLNLVELERQNSIWQKYGVNGGGGGIFLIDERGTILAIDPTTEEVRKELESRLN